ncbi:hypothetical protein BH10ACI1_BH10ACI1_30360 [soil metagenome]
MNRLAGIIVAVIGFLIVVLSIMKVIPVLTQTGIFLILLGGLIIGLSFIPKPDLDDTPRMSTANTLVAIFYSPGEVFQNLRRHPRWLAALFIMTILSAVFFNLFLMRLTPERVTNYAIDKTLEMPLVANNEDARKNVEIGRSNAIEQNKNPVLRAGQAVNGFVGQVFLYAILGAVFFLFALAMGGSINYWQAFSAAVYAYFPVAVIKFILNSVILFIKDPTDIHPIIGQSSLIQDNLNFLVKPSEHAVLYTLLSSFSLLAIFWIWMNATGLKNSGEKVTPTIAWSASLTVFFIMVLLGVVFSWMFSGFMS